MVARRVLFVSLLWRGNSSLSFSKGHFEFLRSIGHLSLDPGRAESTRSVQMNLVDVISHLLVYH